MRKSLCLIFAVLFTIIGCSKKFDDSQIWDTLHSLEDRIAALEQLCRQMNTNITSLQTIVDALENKDYITNISPINEDGKVIGYTMTFSKSGCITIYHGKDGNTPSIDVKKDVDNIYYWTLNGEWLLNGEGKKIKAAGTDGSNGVNGITPRLKIEDNYWHVSYDNGVSWTTLDSAVGKDGEDGDSMFSQITYDENYVYFTLTDGTILEIPRAPSTPPNNEIWYVATTKVEPFLSEAFDTSIVSNEWNATTGEGVITFNGDIIGIGYDAFIGCTSLKSITIPNGVTKIENQAFSGCSSIESIMLPNSVTEIGERVFRDCSSLQSINMPNRVTKIDKGAFYGCKSLLYFTIPDSVTEIGGSAFAGCSSLESINIPNGTKEIGASAFQNCSNLQYATIPNSVTTIGSYAFYGCTSLQSIALPSSMTEIGASTFYGCDGLESVTLSNSMTKIGNNAFYRCISLESITIPNSVIKIGNNAFNGCSKLESIYMKGINPPTGASGMFSNVSSSFKIYIPLGSLDSYKIVNYWKNYLSQMEEKDVSLFPN